MKRRSVAITTGLAGASEAMTVVARTEAGTALDVAAFRLDGATAGAEGPVAVWLWPFPAANAGEDATSKKPRSMLETRLCEEVIRVGWG